MLHAYELVTPKQWQAGTVGEARTPIYFDCAGCGAKAPVIAGYLGFRPDFAGIAMVSRDGRYGKEHHLALYCQPCWRAKYPEVLDGVGRRRR